MTNGTSPAARVLFVIDNDFGALGLAMYLLYRQPLAARATLLLPQRAYEMHKGRLSVASRPYRSLADILDRVAAESPGVVFLFSGYLFARQGVLPIRSLRRLVLMLRQRGCKVVTSDPYIGTFAEMARAKIIVRTGAVHRHLERALGRFPGLYGIVARWVERYSAKRLERHVRRVAEILADVTPLYPVPVDARQGGARSVAFFNPLYIRSEEELAGNHRRVSALPGMDARPRWLFVLAQFDLEFQEKKYGRQGFVDIVAAKLRQSLANGKHPTFIGPAAITAALAREFGRESGVSLLGACSFEEFELRLLDAEVVFYWQVFSTSTFLRLWNGLPVFFFDPGHSAHMSSALREAGLKYYYMGGAPTYLDVEEPLDAARLASFFAAARQSALDSRARLERLPDAAQMVDTIMDGA